MEGAANQCSTTGTLIQHIITRYGINTYKFQGKEEVSSKNWPFLFCPAPDEFIYKAQKILRLLSLIPLCNETLYPPAFYPVILPDGFYQLVIISFALKAHNFYQELFRSG